MRHTLKLRFILAALCSIATVACDDGGSDTDNNMPEGGAGTGGTGATGGDAGAPSMFKITDFETPSTESGKYDGYAEDTTRGWQMAWFTYTDMADMKSAGATITPIEGDPFEAVEDATRVGSPHVGNIKGGGFKSWGAGMGFNFKATPTPVNLSEFKGLSFWGKAAAGTYTIKVKVVDARNTPSTGGGTCAEGMDASGMPKMGLRCFDVPLTKVTLTNEWKRFDLTWDKFKPEGWGMTGYTGPQTDAVISFQFQVGVEASWDVSVDEVGLIQ